MGAQHGLGRAVTTGRQRGFQHHNGDVVEWRNLWPALAETLGAETGPETPTSVTAYLAENADVWDRIVEKYGLRSHNLRELVGYGDQHPETPASQI